MDEQCVEEHVLLVLTVIKLMDNSAICAWLAAEVSHCRLLLYKDDKMR